MNRKPIVEQAPEPEPESPRDIFARIWRQYAEDRKKRRSLACANLQSALALHAADLVPGYATAKELMSMIFDCDEHSGGGEKGPMDDPVQAMADWISGKTELSRIPLESPRKVQ